MAELKKSAGYYGNDTSRLVQEFEKAVEETVAQLNQEIAALEARVKALEP